MHRLGRGKYRWYFSIVIMISLSSIQFLANTVIGTTSTLKVRYYWPTHTVVSPRAKSYPQYQSPYTHETSPTHAYKYAHLYIIKVFGEKHKKNNGTIFFSSSYFHIDWNVCNISKFTKFYSECDKVINGDHIKWHLSI